MKPIDPTDALRRLADVGLTLDDAFALTDDDLLKHETVGRRTLRWVRERQKVRDLYAKASSAMDELARHLIANPEVADDEDGAPDVDAFVALLHLSLDVATGFMGREPHHREADALTEFAYNVRWIGADEENN